MYAVLSLRSSCRVFMILGLVPLDRGSEKGSCYLRLTLNDFITACKSKTRHQTLELEIGKKVVQKLITTYHLMIGME